MLMIRVNTIANICDCVRFCCKVFWCRVQPSQKPGELDTISIPILYMRNGSVERFSDLPNLLSAGTGCEPRLTYPEPVSRIYCRIWMKGGVWGRSRALTWFTRSEAPTQ